MILLDTNICIYIINAKPEAVLKRFQQYRLGEIGLCSVVAAHALSQQATLITNNIREFAQVLGLHSEIYAAEERAVAARLAIKNPAGKPQP
jgi:predicted nucleic acid-binding protein